MANTYYPKTYASISLGLIPSNYSYMYSAGSSPQELYATSVLRYGAMYSNLTGTIDTEHVICWSENANSIVGWYRDFNEQDSTPNILEILEQENCFLFSTSTADYKVIDKTTGEARDDFDYRRISGTSGDIVTTTVGLHKNYYIKHTGDGSLREHWNNSVWSGTPEGFEYMTEAEFEAAFPIPEPEIPPYVEPEPDPRDVVIANLTARLEALENTPPPSPEVTLQQFNALQQQVTTMSNNNNMLQSRIRYGTTIPNDLEVGELFIQVSA